MSAECFQSSRVNVATNNTQFHAHQTAKREKCTDVSLFSLVFIALRYQIYHLLSLQSIVRATAFLGKTPSPALRPPPRLSCFGCWVKLTLMLPCSLTWHGILQKKRRQEVTCQHRTLHLPFLLWANLNAFQKQSTVRHCFWIKSNATLDVDRFTLYFFYIFWPPNQFSSSRSLFDHSPTSRVFSEQTYYLLFLRSPGWSTHLINHLPLIPFLVLLSLSVACCHVKLSLFLLFTFFFPPQHHYPVRHVGGILFFRLKGEKTTFSLFF